MVGPHFRGAVARAVLAALCLFLVAAFAFAPHANAAVRHHHHVHHRHVGFHHRRRYRIAINVQTGAIEPVRDPFSAVASLFQPPAQAAQYQIERGIAVAGAAPAAAMAAPGVVAAFIAEQARARGLNPRWCIHIAATEGLKQYVGDHGTSFGPFQLHYAGRRFYRQHGLGELFTATTGLDARDPHTWRAQVIFALDWARIHGWKHDWYGWQHASIWEANWSGHHHHHHWRA